MQNKKSEILFLGSGPYALDRRGQNDKFEYFLKYYSTVNKSSIVWQSNHCTTNKSILNNYIHIKK